MIDKSWNMLERIGERAQSSGAYTWHAQGPGFKPQHCLVSWALLERSQEYIGRIRCSVCLTGNHFECDERNCLYLGAVTIFLCNLYLPGIWKVERKISFFAERQGRDSSGQLVSLPLQYMSSSPPYHLLLFPYHLPHPTNLVVQVKVCCIFLKTHFLRKGILFILKMRKICSIINKPETKPKVWDLTQLLHHRNAALNAIASTFRNVSTDIYRGLLHNK